MNPDPSDPDTENLSNPTVRERLTPSAVRAFQKIMEFWHVSNDDARELLGGSTAITFSVSEHGSMSTLDEDKLRRIASLLEIFEALNTLYDDTVLADKWIQIPNKDPIFCGITPLEFLKQGGLPEFKIIEGYLNAY